MRPLEDKACGREFLSEDKWLMKVSGCAQSRKLVYNLYRMLLFLVLFYMLLMELLACIFKPEKQLMLEATHYLLGTFCGIWALSSRILAHRLMKASQPFCGAYLLDIFTLASLVFGVQLYLINKNPPMGLMISLVASFIAEQFTVVYLCTLGQDVTEESQKVFNRLYRISWFNYGKRFNRILHIMMSNTLKPMELKAMVFGVPASLEVYGHIVSAMYKITNLARQPDIV